MPTLVVVVAVVLPCILFACAVSPQHKPMSSRAALLADETVEPDVCGNTIKLSRVGDVYLAGQPSPAAYKEFRDRGVRTVINYRRPGEEPSIDTEKIVTDLGMTYQNPAFTSADDVTDEVFDQTRATLNSAEGAVLVQCAAANRVGAAWLTWRVLDGGKDYQSALNEARQIGLRNAKLEAEATDYIVRHRGSTK